MRETIYNFPNLPVEKLALLGDFHNADPEPILASLSAHRPSLICISGDICYADIPEEGSILDEQENIIPFLRGCASIAPTFMSLGNHDAIFCDGDWTFIRSTGVTVLDNEWEEATVGEKAGGEKKVWIGGLTSHYVLERRSSSDTRFYPSPDRERAYIQYPDVSWINPLPEGFKILLSHHPEHFGLVPQDVDLIVSAHAHGGQWRFFDPLKGEWRGVFAPGQGLWPRYTRGVYGGQMVVTAGLRNTAKIPRLFNPTEIVYLSPS